MTLCRNDNEAIFSALYTWCGPFAITQLKFQCQGSWFYPMRDPKSVISKNGTFPCGKGIWRSTVQQIPFVDVSVYVVKNGRLRLSHGFMSANSYLMAVNGALYTKAGNIYLK